MEFIKRYILRRPVAADAELNRRRSSLIADRKRESNIELLRILLAFYIVLGHVIIFSGKLTGGGCRADQVFANLTQSFTSCAVNCFVIISGYYGIRAKWEKLININIRTVLYTYSFLVLALLLGIHRIEVKKDILLLFPVLTNQYWFITTYFFLYIISPFLNSFLTQLQSRQLKTLLIINLLLFYLLPTICYTLNARQTVSDSGYGIVNFICLYTFGYYLRNYYLGAKSSKHYFCLYAISAILLFLCNYILTAIFGFYFNSFISYNTVFNLFCAIFLFLTFLHLRVERSLVIDLISSKTLAIYIIHMNPSTREYIFEKVFNVDHFTGAEYFPLCVAVSLVIVLSATIIDSVIDTVFLQMERRISNGLYVIIKRLIESFGKT